MEITGKVLEFMKKKKFQGIILSKVEVKFGWVGCQEEIQGEFLKEEELKKYSGVENLIVVENKGIKVFVPLNIKSVDKLVIDSQFSFFGVMKLKIFIK